jgi:hypothetical protein
MFYSLQDSILIFLFLFNIKIVFFKEFDNKHKDDKERITTIPAETKG